MRVSKQAPKPAARFFSSNTDSLIGTKGPDRFVLKRTSDGLYQQLDTIVGYQKNDIIDLPGQWGKRGGGMTLKRPLFSHNLDSGSLRDLVERNLKPRSAGLFQISGQGASNPYTALVWNLGSAQLVSNQDVIIGLGTISGPVLIV